MTDSKRQLLGNDIAIMDTLQLLIRAANKDTSQTSSFDAIFFKLGARICETRAVLEGSDE